MQSNKLFSFILNEINSIFVKSNIETPANINIAKTLTQIILDNCPNVENKEDYIANVLKKLKKLPVSSSIQAVLYRDGEIILTCFQRDLVDGSFGDPYLFTIKY